MSYNNLTQRDIAQAIMDVNVRGNTLLRKKGLDTPLYTTTYDVCNKIKLLTPTFNIDFDTYQGTADKNSIWIPMSTKPDEITVNSDNLPYTEYMGEIDMTDIIGKPIFYNNYLCWFTKYKLNRYNLDTKIIEYYNEEPHTIIYHYSEIFCYDKYIVVINATDFNEINYIDIYDIEDLSKRYRVVDTVKTGSHRVIGNLLYIYGKIGEEPHPQYPNNPDKNVDIIGYKTYNFDTGAVTMNVKSPYNIPQDIVEYEGKWYHAQFEEDTSSSSRYVEIYEYNINTFEKKLISKILKYDSTNSYILYQTIINGCLYVLIASPDDSYIYYTHYRLNTHTNPAKFQSVLFNHNTSETTKFNDYKDLTFLNYYNTIFIVGGTQFNKTCKDIYKFCLFNQYNSNRLIDVFKELPDTYTSSFTHFYNNKIYLLHKDSVDTLMSYDIGLLRSRGYLNITTGNGDEKYPLINHNNFKLDVNINSIKYYDYNFTETNATVRIYKDGKWQYILK